MVREASFMSIQVSFYISNINTEEFEVRWKLSKNRKWPIIWICQKWKGFQLKITSSRKLQMKFCPTWKLKIFLSHFQKVQDHEFLMCGWRDMDQSWPSEHGTSTSHNFWSKAPIWVPLFAFWSSWHIISKSFITLHEISSHDHLLILAHFGGKFGNLKLVHHMNEIPLPLCLWDHFKWNWSCMWYCSRPICHAPPYFPILPYTSFSPL